MRARSILAAAFVAFAVMAMACPANARPNDALASADDAAVRERSRAAFRRGVTQLRAQDWAGARASFEEAWSLVQHPSILLNLGIARLHTDDPVAAEQDLVRFLSEDQDAAADEQASARDALAEARSQIGTLHVIATPPAARVLVDGKPMAVRVTSDEGPRGVVDGRFKAGTHTVKVEADGFASRTQSVDVKAKSDTTVKVLLAADAVVKPPPPEGPSTRAIVGWSLAGTSGVALVVSGILGFRAISMSHDYTDRTSSSFQRPDVKSEGIAFRTGADVALLAGLIAGAGAAVFLFTDIGGSHTSALGFRDPALLHW